MKKMLKLLILLLLIAPLVLLLFGQLGLLAGSPPEGLGLTDGNLLIYFMAIDGCKFRRKVIPGDVLMMDVTTTRGKPGGKVWRFKGVATVDGELAAEAEFTAMMDLRG